MTYQAPAETGPQDPSAPGAPASPRAVLADVRAAVSIFVGLVVIGALLGVVWAVWSPPGPRALVIAPGQLQADETEAFVAGDGRFLVLALAAGLIAGLLAWRRKANRGPLVPAALALGGLAGSLLMELVGRLAGGGTTDGKANTIIDQLPLTLHLQGLVFVQAAAGVLVYGLLVAFAGPDDLGRPDPVRDEMLRARLLYPQAPFDGHPAPYPYPQNPYPQGRQNPYPQAQYPPPPRPMPSVRPGDQAQDGGGDGDTPGVLQKRDLPPQ